MSSSHKIRCTGCGDEIAGQKAAADFRCVLCGGLYEVIYPWSPGANASGDAPIIDARLPNPSALRWLWQERRTSTMAVDQSGVWRFRDLLPILDDPDQAVTLREGNTRATPKPSASTFSWPSTRA